MVEVLLLRVTFYLFIGNVIAVKLDLDKVISLKDVNVKVYLKMCVCMWKKLVNKNEVFRYVLLNFLYFDCYFLNDCFCFGGNYI